ncbi:MAG: pyridoxamine 5'-phosphate oxidase family protein [Proteobacteria bacterium]|nr:pyridoxamine 5'-phosphate oxidase family protein [Pseudomonadota bacterium]
MGIQLDDEELGHFLNDGHTLILATIRKSGEPFLTPIWYVYDDGALYIRTPARSAKIQHIKRDPRVCCMLEQGDKWVDLKAAVLPCHAEIVDDAELCNSINRMFSKKYADFTPNLKSTPKATSKHYSQSTATVKLMPRRADVRSWFNRKIKGMEKSD